MMRTYQDYILCRLRKRMSSAENFLFADNYPNATSNIIMMINPIIKPHVPV